MQILRFFIIAFFFIPCAAMEYSISNNLTLTIKDLDPSFPEGTQTLPSLEIPIVVLESFAKIKDYVDLQTNVNKTEPLKQILILSLNNAPSFNLDQKSSKKRIEYLKTFFNCTHALYRLNVRINSEMNKYNKESKYCFKVTTREFQDYLNINTLSIDDCINIGMDLDYLTCNKDMLRFFAHYCFDSDIYSKIISTKKGNDKIKLIKRILKENALSIGDILIKPSQWKNSTFFSVGSCGIRTLHGIKNIANQIDTEQITTIYLNNNYLTSCEIAKIRKHFKNVKWFFYGDNYQIKSITREDLDALSAIKGNYLNLSDCPITDFPIDHLENIRPIRIEYTCSSMGTDPSETLRTKIKKKIKEIKESKIKNYSTFNHLNYFLFYLLNTLLYAYGFTKNLDLYKKYEYNPPVHKFDDGWVTH